jgi:hypothetical protein
MNLYPYPEDRRQKMEDGRRKTKEKSEAGRHKPEGSVNYTLLTSDFGHRTD